MDATLPENTDSLLPFREACRLNCMDHAEGIRTVVDMPWSTYAFLCLLLPLPFIYLMSCWVFRNTRQRIITFLAASVAFLPCALSFLGLAQRIFIGKF